MRIIFSQFRASKKINRFATHFLSSKEDQGACREENTVIELNLYPPIEVHPTA